MKKQDSSMQQYLNQVRIKVDALAAAGSKVDVEDIILHVLNGLPSNYDTFATAIRTRASTVNLDELYALLCSEEIIIQNKEKQQPLTDSSFALLASRG